MTADYEDERTRLREANVAISERMTNEIANLKEAHAAKAEELTSKIEQIESELAQTRSEFNDVSSEKCLTEARLKATRAANGLMGDEDFTDRTRFNELEREYTAFMKFYDEQWQKVKKKIRQEALSVKNLKKKKNADEAEAVANEDIKEESPVNEETVMGVAEEISNENTLNEEQKGQDE